jgi:hypothetical protein
MGRSPPASEAGASRLFRHARPRRRRLACSATARPQLPAPGAPVGLDEETVDGDSVWLGRKRRPLERLRKPLLDLLDLCNCLIERALAGSYCHHPRAPRLRHGQGQPADLQAARAPGSRAGQLTRSRCRRRARPLSRRAGRGHLGYVRPELKFAVRRCPRFCRRASRCPPAARAHRNRVNRTQSEHTLGKFRTARAP